jgi:hypothetical protein
MSPDFMVLTERNDYYIHMVGWFTDAARPDRKKIAKNLLLSSKQCLKCLLFWKNGYITKRFYCLKEDTYEQDRVD